MVFFFFSFSFDFPSFPLAPSYQAKGFWSILGRGREWLDRKAVSYHIFWRRQWHPTPVLLPGKSHGGRSLVGCSPWGRWGSDTTERLHFHFHTLEKEMATHSSILAWRIPGTGEPGGLKYFFFIPGLGSSPGEGIGSPLQYSCLENPMDTAAWRSTVHGGHKESDMT